MKIRINPKDEPCILKKLASYVDFHESSRTKSNFLANFKYLNPLSFWDLAINVCMWSQSLRSPKISTWCLRQFFYWFPDWGAKCPPRTIYLFSNSESSMARQLYSVTYMSRSWDLKRIGRQFQNGTQLKEVGIPPK